MLSGILLALGVTVADPVAVAETGEESVVDSLRLCAEQRWQALLQRDYASAYAFQSPAYRGVFSLDQFRRTGVDELPAIGFGIDRVELHDTQQIGTRTKASTLVVSVEYRVALPVGLSGVTRTHREHWLWRDGQCWYITRS